jgi:tRNA uridine 5-carboxymethylaminomethyl modification enzyme
MFTSRAEHRLILRHDNADLRLTPKAAVLGLADSRRLRVVKERLRAIDSATNHSRSLRLDGTPLFQLMKRPTFNLSEIPSEILRLHPPDIWQHVETEAKYEGYVKRQQHQIESMRYMRGRLIPQELDYFVVPGLRTEARQKLTAMRPATVGQAAEISGVTPSDVGIIDVWLNRTAGVR